MEAAVQAAAWLVRPGGWLAVMTTGKELEKLESAAGEVYCLAEVRFSCPVARTYTCSRSSQASVRQLDERQLANFNQILELEPSVALLFLPDSGGASSSTLSVLSDSVDCRRGRDCLIAQDERNTEAPLTRAQIDDVSLLDFEAERPSVFLPGRLPLLFVTFCSANQSTSFCQITVNSAQSGSKFFACRLCCSANECIWVFHLPLFLPGISL